MLWALSLPLIVSRMIAVPDVVSETEAPKRERAAEREPLVAPPPAPISPITLPDEVIVRAVDAARPSFVACFKRALATELVDPPLKIRVHLELDAAGKIIGGTTDAPTPALGNCLLRVSYGLSFGTPGKPGSVDVPLFFR